MTDIDLSWMNVPNASGVTWAQANANPALTIDQQKAWSELTQVLNNFGLSSMNERVKQYIIENGTEDPTRIRLWLMEQPEFKTRFPAMETLSKAGRAMTPEQYIQAEQQYITVMRQAGLKPEFFDEEPGKAGVQFHKLIANEVLPEEFRTRVQDGYNRVANASPLVRDAFKNYFGVEGDQALAAFFIDPDRATPALIKAANTAEMGAAGRQADINVDFGYATRLAEMGVTYSQAQQGMQRLSQLEGLFDGGVGEAKVVSGGAGVVPPPAGAPVAAPNGRQQGRRTPAVMPPSTITPTGTPGTGADDAGLDYVFGTNQRTQQELERRLEARKAQASGTNQQATMDKKGGTNLGSAK